LTINERIKMFRKSKKLSQKQFALSLGVTQSGVSYMEQDGSTVSDASIKTICSVYGLNEEWLRSGTEPMVDQSDTFSLDQYLQEKGCSALEISVVKSYFQLDSKTRQAVFDFFRSRLDAAKERLAAEMAPPPEAAMLPLELKSPVDMTDEEIDRTAEQIRQEMRREKAAVEKPQVFPGFGTNSSGPPIGGSGGGASGSATG
jgi:transcriptional regulator with XRE-family HTH domain